MDAAERKRIIAEGIAALAADEASRWWTIPGCSTRSPDWWNGRCRCSAASTTAYMDLPPEVLQVSMRVNQRYFAFRNADGSAAPYFGFVANIEPADGGATSIAGNERVLRARFADARHFWDLDRKARLESRVPLLDHVTFHAKLGTRASGCAGWNAWPRRSRRWSAPARRWRATPRGSPRPTWSPAWSASSPNCRA